MSSEPDVHEPVGDTEADADEESRQRLDTEFDELAESEDTGVRDREE
jgi:hypothetical protein